MNLQLCSSLFLGTVAAAICGTACAAPPTIFAPGVISGPLDDGSPAFAPDGKTIFFMRGAEGKWAFMRSHRQGGRWSAPQTASFSGRWHDEDPAMAIASTMRDTLWAAASAPGQRVLYFYSVHRFKTPHRCELLEQRQGQHLAA